MRKQFKSYDRLSLFSVVARHLNFTTAAEELNMTKGAVSYQIRCLESEVGFVLFNRRSRGVELTDKGVRLVSVCDTAFDMIDKDLGYLREQDRPVITIGMSTYFASRWLSPRLMRFTSVHPQIGLRLQPTSGVVDPRKEGIDLLIRWGHGQWEDLQIEPLFLCPAFATGNQAIADRIDADGLEQVMARTTLLHDVEGSPAWQQWYQRAGLNYPPARNNLVIPDPNVRVQAVIDGQGLALNDSLVNMELQSGQLLPVLPVTLDEYGYFLAHDGRAIEDESLAAFVAWLREESQTGQD